MQTRIIKTRDQSFEVYSHEIFKQDCRRIAEWARKKRIHSIFGIPRGGLVPAVYLSHLLGLPMILHRDDITPQTLIVDDIVDHGNTLKALLASLGGKFMMASLYIAKYADPRPDFHCRVKRAFVIFPWEEPETARYDGTLQKTL